MSERELRVHAGDGRMATAIATGPETARGLTFVYAPGAGSNVHDPFGRYLGREAAERGLQAVRFQFPYQEMGKRSPDRPDVLEATWQAVIAHFAGEPLIVGGRSMGGRIASQVVARGADVAGLVLFAYPLHPPGKPEQRRDAHLPQIAVPTLFCSGTNDAFASPDELRGAAAMIPGSAVHLLDGADHGFSVKKASGRTREDVFAEACSVFFDWLPMMG